jgi:drug/metabolite transporter (DMT)-like permease
MEFALSLGVISAFCALIGWGFGDFFIQRATRVVGIQKSLFIICIATFVVLLPFIADELPNLAPMDHLRLVLLGTVMFVFAVILFAAFRVGKISVVEAVVAVELPLTVAYSVIVGGEHFPFVQTVLIACISVGILLTAAERLEHLHYHKRILEKGAGLAFMAAGGSALVNYYVGDLSRDTSPLLTIWYTHTFIALLSGAYLFYNGGLWSLKRDLIRHPVPLIGQTFFDNFGWVTYAAATTLLPISIAASISESYIILAAMLGYLVNKERLNSHQKVGIVVTLISVVLLTALVG